MFQGLTGLRMGFERTEKDINFIDSLDEKTVYKIQYPGLEKNIRPTGSRKTMLCKYHGCLVRGYEFTGIDGPFWISETDLLTYVKPA